MNFVSPCYYRVMQNIIPLRTTCLIGERWPVDPFEGQFPDPRFRSQIVQYKVRFKYAQLMIEPEYNLTVVTFNHSYVLKGSLEAFVKSAKGKALPKIARYIVQLVNRLIDLVQGNFEENEDNPFPHIRRVGVRDFVLMDCLYGERRQNLFSYAIPGLHSKFADRGSGLVSKIDFSTEVDPSLGKIRLLRAVELLNTGYHTEALLISFALLDSFVQNVLENTLSKKGVSDPKGFLERILSNRMNTYMGPLLKVATGHSLQEDKPELWRKLDRFNKHRNEAIHDNVDIEYEKAKEGIETTRDILLYFQQILAISLIPDLDVAGLPFLLEYIGFNKQ